MVIKVVETSDSWGKKKVNKTGQCLSLFTKSVKVLVQSQFGAEVNAKVQRQGLLIIKAIEKECEKDKSLCNLKGKIKEIKTIIDNI